jgi:hypothetical protein
VSPSASGASISPDTIAPMFVIRRFATVLSP